MNRLQLGKLGGEYVHKLTEPFLRRLRSLAPLTSNEEQFIDGLQLSPHAFNAGAHVYTEGDPTIQPWIVGAGWACRLRVLPDGRRQIVSFFLPGDTIGVGDGENVSNVMQACRMQLVWTQAQLLDQILRLGRLTALERMAHLLLELHYRMQDAGLAQDGKFPLPLTQSQFGEALGLSLVHVNRTLQQLRRDQLIELRPGRVAILDRERLALLCDFRKPTI